MSELVATRGTGQLFDHPRRERLLEYLQEPGVGEIVDQPLQLVEPEIPADHRSDHKRLVAALGETLEAYPDHLAHHLRDSDAPAHASVEPLRSQLSLLHDDPDA